MTRIDDIYLVLELLTILWGSSKPQSVEIGAFPESEEPNEGSNNKDTNGISQKYIIGYYKANSDVVALYNPNYGNEERHDKSNSHDRTSCRKYKTRNPSTIHKKIPVKSAVDSTMFIKILGLRQTIESASETMPAASNKKLKVAQTPISTLETMLLGY